MQESSFKKIFLFISNSTISYISSEAENVAKEMVSVGSISSQKEESNRPNVGNALK